MTAGQNSPRSLTDASMDICTRTLLPTADTIVGIAATGSLVSLVARIVLGIELQVALSLLFFFISWTLVLAGTVAVLLPLGTCQFAISIDYVGYGIAYSLYTSYFNIAILVSVNAAMLSSCLGAWNAVTDQLGDKEHWRGCRDRKWLATIVLLSIEAAGRCKEGMEFTLKSKTVWGRLFWLWPRFIHNYVKVFRRLGGWVVTRELRRFPLSRTADNGGNEERADLLPGTTGYGTQDTGDDAESDDPIPRGSP
ncbi:hypothetical protein DL767_003612 [Monosporascus sp. MG133]|nr:hypothetical protein DL767_003612 [Monosporascus sp. MG133]